MTDDTFGRVVPPIFPHHEFPERPPIRYLMIPQRERWEELNIADALKWFLPTVDQVKQTRYSEVITAQVGAAPELDIRKDKL